MYLVSSVIAYDVHACFQKSDESNLVQRFQHRYVGDVENCRYLRVDLAADGTMEVSHLMGEGVKVIVTLKTVWKERSLFGRSKIDMCEGITVLTILYRCEAWAAQEDVQRRVEVLEMKCGIRWFD